MGHFPDIPTGSHEVIPTLDLTLTTTVAPREDILADTPLHPIVRSLATDNNSNSIPNLPEFILINPQGPAYNLQSWNLEENLADVQCHKCRQFGHYANRCPAADRQQYQHATLLPTPLPRSQNCQDPPAPTYAVTKVETPLPDSSTDGKLNTFNDEFVTTGFVNGIKTTVIVDSGAKRSLVLSDFITTGMSPISLESLRGVFNTIQTLPIYNLTVDIPTLTLPPKTILVGTDFGQEKFVELINAIKLSPLPVNTVTRAMNAEGKLAENVSEVLHASEGCHPQAVEDIPEDEEDVETADEPAGVGDEDTTHTLLLIFRLQFLLMVSTNASLPNFNSKILPLLRYGNWPETTKKNSSL